MAAKKEEKQFLTYKGKPLIRRENKIYYGDINGSYYIEFTINQTEKYGDMDIASNVVIELKENSAGKKGKQVKKAERENLYIAMDIAEFWLLDALGEV